MDDVGRSTENRDLIPQRTEKVKSRSEQSFDTRITSAFNMMREDLERTAKETNTYANKMVGLLGQLEELHLRKHASLNIIKDQPHVEKEKLDDLLLTYSALLDELAPWRMRVVRAGEEVGQHQSARMQKSCKGIMSAAKRRLDEGREKQQLATDASEMVKHYKALIMAT